MNNTVTNIAGARDSNSRIDEVIKDFRIAVKKDTKIIEEVSKVLYKEKYMHSLNEAVSKSLEHVQLNDKTRAAYIADITSRIYNSNIDLETIDYLSVQIADGGIINHDAFNELHCPLGYLLPHKGAIEVFEQLYDFNNGIKQTGKAEWALTVLSGGDISFPDKGDLQHDDHGNIELKFASGKSGGRLQSAAPERSNILAVFEKYKHLLGIDSNDVIPKSMAISVWVELLNKHTPACTRANRNKRVQFAHDLFSPLFGAHATELIALLGESTATASEVEQAYAAANFNYYKEENGFDVLVAISYPSEYMVNIRTSEQLVQLMNMGILTNPGICVLPSGSGARETAAQINISNDKKKLVALAPKNTINVVDIHQSDTVQFNNYNDRKDNMNKNMTNNTGATTTELNKLWEKLDYWHQAQLRAAAMAAEARVMDQEATNNIAKTKELINKLYADKSDIVHPAQPPSMKDDMSFTGATYTYKHKTSMPRSSIKDKQRTLERDFTDHFTNGIILPLRKYLASGMHYVAALKKVYYGSSATDKHYMISPANGAGFKLHITNNAVPLFANEAQMQELIKMLAETNSSPTPQILTPANAIDALGLKRVIKFDEIRGVTALDKVDALHNMMTEIVEQYTTASEGTLYYQYIEVVYENMNIRKNTKVKK